MTFGSRLKELRTKNNMTQRELSEKLFVTRQAVTKWENDRSIPEDDTLERLASIFNVSTYFLLHGVEEVADQPKKQFNPRSYIKTAIILTLSLILLVVIIIVPLNVYSTNENENDVAFRYYGSYVTFDEMVEIKDPDDLYMLDVAYQCGSDRRYFSYNTLIVPEGEFSKAYVYDILYSWDDDEYIINKPIELDLTGGIKEYTFSEFDLVLKEMVPLKTIKINYIGLKHESILEELIYLDDDGKLKSSVNRRLDSYKLELMYNYLTASYTVEATNMNGDISRYMIYETKNLLLYIKNPKKPFTNNDYLVRFEI